jgi:hypothetical protein
MLHPALARALVTAHIEDQLRAASRWHTVRLARRARATRGGELQSPLSDPRRLDAVDHASQTRGMTRTEIPQATPWPCKPVVDVRSGAQAGIDLASSTARPVSSHTRTSRGSE